MERELILGGRVYILGSLGQPMDQAFDRLHAAHFGGAALPWEEFEAAAAQYFTENPDAPGAHDGYFNNFTHIWQSALGSGNFEVAEHIWRRALQPALAWERAQQGRLLHKGTPYYFWAMTALLRGDTDHGYLLIHQAVGEDARTHRERTPDTPGYALVTLNYKRVDQAFREWVVAQARFFSALIANYGAIYGSPLTFDDVKRRFIDRPPDVETIFLLTYTLARLRKIAALPAHATNNAFAGQVQLNLFFDVTLVIETAIRAQNPTLRRPNGSALTFIDQAEHLLLQSGHALTNAQLREINGQFNSNFEATLQLARVGALVLQDGTILDRFQADVALTYGIRNHGAHNTGTAPTIWNNFPDLQQILFRTLCATVEHLY